MKKYIYLIVLLIISSLIFSGCAITTIGEKYTLPGRHYWNQQPKPVELQNDLEDIMRTYRITVSRSVIIIKSNEPQAEKFVKEALVGFGFTVYANRYSGPADYEITVERQDIGEKMTSSGYYYSYSGRTEAVVEVKLTVLKGYTERYFVGVGSYSDTVVYSGYYYQSQNIQDPFLFATKVAAAKAVAKLIDEENIPHQYPEKK